MDQTIYRVMEMGASLDGPIQYPPHGKVGSGRGLCAIRHPVLILDTKRLARVGCRLPRSARPTDT